MASLLPGASKTGPAGEEGTEQIRPVRREANRCKNATQPEKRGIEMKRNVIGQLSLAAVTAAMFVAGMSVNASENDSKVNRRSRRPTSTRHIFRMMRSKPK